jgi:beta-mannosidase
MLSIEDEGLLEKVFITNDTLLSVAGMVRIKVESLAGNALFSAENTFIVGAQTVVKVSDLDCSAFVTGGLLREAVFIAEFWQANQLMDRKTAFFAPVKHLNLTDPKITSKVEVVEDEVRVTLLAETLALQVELSFKDMDCVFSDNYFDLPANTALSVTACLNQAISIETLESRLRIQTIYDSYAH